MKEFKPADGPHPVGQSWVRLTRKGEIVSAFQSSDGKFWQQVDSHKVPMGEDVLAGVALDDGQCVERLGGDRFGESCSGHA